MTYQTGIGLNQHNGTVLTTATLNDLKSITKEEHQRYASELRHIKETTDIDQANFDNTNCSFLVCDLETTGLGRDSEIVQIASLYNEMWKQAAV